MACRFLFIVGLILTVGQHVWAWTSAHNQASKMAATASLAPKPFASYPEHCAFGVYPDQMNDWDIAQGENGRWAVWLLVREATDALRHGDAPRACFLASVANHYPQDDLCMSHSPLLKMTRSDPSADLLPVSLQPLLGKLPVERRTVHVRRYGRSNMQTVTERGFFNTPTPPTLLTPLYEGAQRYVHDWLEDTAAALSLPPERRRSIVGADTLGDRKEWSWQEIVSLRQKALKGTVLEGLTQYERCEEIAGESFYHRWLTANYQGQWLLPFALFESWDSQPKFRDGEALKAVFAEEFRLGVDVMTVLYRYVAVAAEAQIDADWGSLNREDARLDAMAKDGVAVVVTENRPDWQRAAALLHQELVFGTERQKVKADIILVAEPKEASEFLGGRKGQHHHLVVLKKGESYRLEIHPRTQNSSRLSVRLQVPKDDLEAMGNMVDLLLDEGKAPLWSASPPMLLLDALRDIWAGRKLMEALRNERSPEELLQYVRAIPFRNTEEDKMRFAEAVQSAVRVPGSFRWIRWWISQAEK